VTARLSARRLLAGACLATTLGGSGCVGPAASAPSPLEQRYVENPGDPRVNFELGFGAEQAGDFLRAEQYYRRVESLTSETRLRRQVSHRIVVVLARALRYQEALERCQQLLRDEPADRPARLLLAAILVSVDRPREAERELQSLRRTKPEDPVVYLELGKVYRDVFADRPRADLMFRRYLALAPEGPEADSLRFEMEARRLEASSDGGMGEAAPPIQPRADGGTPAPRNGP
jgi:predicted Zn-dependent protease